MTLPRDIAEYHAKLSDTDLAICELLATEINLALPQATAKVWHAHPVWFMDGNPLVGYHRLKASLRLLFWSGQSFDAEGLTPEGSFKAADARYTQVDQIDVAALRSWLAQAIEIQWDYQHIRTNKGLVKRTEF